MLALNLLCELQVLRVVHIEVLCRAHTMKICPTLLFDRHSAHRVPHPVLARSDPDEVGQVANSALSPQRNTLDLPG